MCGITGVVHKIHQSVDLVRLSKMRDALIHRGPDAGSIFCYQNVGLAHRRLSIIDLSDAATQPFHSPCGRYVLVFNGEIFNYQELKRDLQAQGVSFVTQSDTEVLLQLLIRDGVGCLPRLNGFWALAFYDTHQKEMWLIRDRMGIKPLFYCQTADYFAFASEPKALFAYGHNKRLDVANLDELFLYRHVSGQNTVFHDVKRILPGYYAKISHYGDIVQMKRWYHLGEAAKNHFVIQDPAAWFEETFLSSIRYRMIADVNVGTMLSGGLDSSSVLYAQHKLGYPHTTAWNISFSDQNHDESALARRFAKDLGMAFHSFEFAHAELAQLTLDAMDVSDEPFMHVQEPQMLGLCRKAKEQVSVLLSGEAADELLGGYVRYKVHDNQWRYRFLQLLKFVPAQYIRNDRWLKLKRYLSMRNQDMQCMMNANHIFLQDLEDWKVAALNLLPDYRVSVLEEAKEIYPNNPLRQLMYMEQFTHLPTLNDRNDRVSMGASIENREPFEDYRLTAGVMSLPDSYFTMKGKGKKLLMDTIGRHLPSYITQHRKIGLSIPWDDIIITQPFFRSHFDNMLQSKLLTMGPYAQLDLKEACASYARGDRRNAALIRQVFFQSLWYETQFEA